MDSDSSDVENEYASDLNDEDEDFDEKLKYSEPDPLYNEKADEEDEKWMTKHFPSMCISNSHASSLQIPDQISADKGKSDARLSCPYCFTLLCTECQRHQTYWNQFRAVFVKNCNVLKQKEIKYRTDESMHELTKRKPKNERIRPWEYVDTILVEDEHNFEQEIYYPVHCGVCDTEVGIMDEEGIYHFHDVVPSEA